MTAQVMLVFLVLISVARSCIIPFLSLYLKFVGLGIFEVGLIQGIKSWIAIIFIALFSSLGKYSLDRKWKRVFISGTVTISLTACTCLMYVPPHQDPPDVTHCRMSFKQDTSTSIDNTHSRNSSNVSEFEFQAKSIEKNMVVNVSTKHPKHTLTFKIPSVKTYYNTEKDKQNSSKSVQELFTVYKNNTYLPHNLFNSSFSGVNSASHLKYFSDVESDNISFTHARKFNKSRHDFTNISDELVAHESSSIVPYSGLPFHGVSHNEGRKHIFFNKHDRGKTRHVLSPWNRVVKTNANYIKPNRISYTSQDYNKDDLNNSPITGQNAWNKLSKILSVDSNLLESDEHSANKLLQQRTEAPSQYWYFDHPMQVRNKTQHIFDRVKKADKSEGRSLGNSLRQQILSYPSSPNVNANPALNKGPMSRTLLSLKADNISEQNTFISVLRRETDTFMTILLLVTFFEISSSSLKPYCEQFADEEAYSNKVHVWSLLTWGVAGCPILALLTVSRPCPDQLTHHLLLAAILFFLTLVMAVFILPIPSKKYRERKLSKPTPEDDTSYLHRICASLTAVVTGVSTACYFEFLLWNIDSLQGFPYNYEFLYCGYYSVSALVEVLVFMRLHESAKIKIAGNVESSTDESEEDEKVIFPKKDCGLCDPVMIGHVLLSIQLCALVFIESAWFLLLLAPLSGCCHGLLHPTRTSHWHAVGYGLGCLFSGIAIHTFGMKTLFSTAAVTVFGWSALCFGLKSYVSCRPVSSYSHIPQSVEDDCDWLEAALQQEAQQS